MMSIRVDDVERCRGAGDRRRTRAANCAEQHHLKQAEAVIGYANGSSLARASYFRMGMDVQGDHRLPAVMNISRDMALIF